jgi:hypothetical protein
LTLKAWIAPDEELETIEEHFGLGEEPVSLYTDCMGVKHYLTKNQACQVDLVDGKLLIQKSSRADFDRVVTPCRANLGELYYFEDVSWLCLRKERKFHFDLIHHIPMDGCFREFRLVYDNDSSKRYSTTDCQLSEYHGSIGVHGTELGMPAPNAAWRAGATVTLVLSVWYLIIPTMELWTTPFIRSDFHNSDQL